MNKFAVTRFTIMAVLVATIASSALNVFAAGGDPSIWQPVEASRITAKGRRLIVPDKFVVFRADQKALKSTLDSAPLEFTDAARDGYVIFEVPTPEGKLQRFRLEESPILAPNVAAQFPSWKTFSGQGIDDPTAMARFDINVNGFHGYVSGADGTYLINPYSEFDRTNFIVYYKGSLTRDAGFSCRVEGGRSPELDIKDAFGLLAPKYSNGTSLRTLRLAVSATKEYTNFFGGDINAAFAAITTSVNRMIVVYRRELAVTFTLVSNTSTVFTNANNGGFPAASNPEVSGLSITHNQTVIDNAYGNVNYDIGHVVSQTDNPNGVAMSPSICDDESKAQGFTGGPTPAGDGYDVDYFAHEIGHQFGMDHTYNNSVDGSCGSGRSDTVSYEPASGVTIMGYGGICGPRNLASNSIEFFHAGSLQESLLILGARLPAPGGTCGTAVSIANTPPVVSAGANYTIPKLTPFTLTGSAVDATNNGLTYSWEENDLGTPTGSTGDVDTDATGARPILRSYNPSTSPSRTFPSLPYILNNANQPPATYAAGASLPNAPTSGSIAGYVCAANEQAPCITGESLPSIARTMNFRLTVRDNLAAGGGIADATMQLTVSAATGPFVVTSPNTGVTYAGNSAQTVTWDVAGTSGAPVNASNVKISFSSDGGQNFSTVLLPSTPNDGSETVTIPNTATTSARIKVEAVGNIFFDVSNANFTVTSSGPAARTAFDFDGDGKSDESVFRPSDNVWYLNRSQAGFVGYQFGTPGDAIAPADFTGDGKTDVAVFRPSAGAWFILKSEDSTFYSANFGSNGDVAAPGDFDGDGKADTAVFRPSTGYWFLQQSTAGFSAVPFGTSGDVPTLGDFDGDSKTDVAVFRPSNGVWYRLNSSNGSFFGAQFGQNGDQVVPADYSGDGKTDLAIWRPSNGTWYIQRSEDNSFYGQQFGSTGDVPAPGDFDGDGKADVVVFRPSNGVWFQQRSTAGFAAVQFGANGDKPAPNAFVY